MKAALLLCLNPLLLMLFLLCTNEDVVFTPPADHYLTETTLTDSSSGSILTDTVYPGQKVLFKGIILKGDSSKVTPAWNIVPSARYTFFYEFTSAGNYPVIFTISDSAGFDLADTLMVHVKKIDNALISGRAFLYGEKDNRNIKVIFRSSDNREIVFSTDSTGCYARDRDILPGTYTMIVEEVKTGYIYKKDSLPINVIKETLKQIPDITLEWSYAITPDNISLSNDTILQPFTKMSFPVEITDMHESKVNIMRSVTLNNSQKQSMLISTDYTFTDCGNYGINIHSSDTLHNTGRKDMVNVYTTWDKQNIIKSGDSTQTIVNYISLLVSGRNRKTEGIRFFSWDFNNDGKYEKDTALSSNALYTYSTPGDYTAVCKSSLNSGKILSDTFHISVLPNNITDRYTYQLKVRDVLTNETINRNQIVFAGKELSFTAEFSKGDTNKVKPFWRVGNSGSDTVNTFSFKHIFTDTGFVTIEFSISDSAGAFSKDTFTLCVNKVINGGAVRGKALFMDKNSHKGMIVQVVHAGELVCSMYTDSSGLYKSTDGIPQGTYEIIVHDSLKNSEYIPDTVKNVTINYGMFTTVNLVLEDKTGPHFNNITPSNYLFNDSLLISAQMNDLGAGVDKNTFILLVNGSVVNRSEYTLDGFKLLYSFKPALGNYDIKAAVKDGAGNISDTIRWAFSRVDTLALIPLQSGKSIEISVNDSVLFFPYDKWLDEKTHKFVVSIGEKIVVDSLNFTNAKFVFKTEGDYTIRYTELFQGKEVLYGTAYVHVIIDAPSVLLPQDTVIDLSTSITLKSKINQKYGKIVSYEWRVGDSIISGAKSDNLVTLPESLPGVNRVYILNCTDDDNNIGSDTVNVSFGRWVVLGNKGFTDTADFQRMTICNGTPYVAYRTSVLFNMYLMCMKYAGGNWVYAGDTIGRYVCPFSITSSENEPVIALGDMTEGVDPIVYTELKSGIWRNDTTLNKTSFEPDLLDSNAVSLKVYNNVPYISFIKWKDSTGYLITRRMGVWEKVIDQPFADGHASNVQLQISNGLPYVSYIFTSGNSNKLCLKMLNNTQWNSVGAEGVQDNIWRYSFCINNDIPCIATISGESKKLSVKCFINNQWKDITAPYDGTCSYLSLHSFRQHLFIAYNVSSDQNRAIVKVLDGERWLDAGYVSGGASRYISLASDSSNLYVVYADGQCDYRTTVMQLK